MARTVLLRHHTPDGGHHYDWLLAPLRPADGLGPDSRVLIAFRLAEPPDAGVTRAATRLPPHRLLYLGYQGPLRDLGRVERVAAGRILDLQESPGSLDAVFDLAGASLRAVGRGGPGDGGWEIRFEPA